ncbi:hypothetical protein ACFOLA_02135 [Salinicoccus hispanicus]|uniref:Uncharacterized protein n=1 Tax=Salinicoccus hispanicus TaxID=157225 RepID=A0A6N8U1Z3_9STAP|nr:hypothetical protein [Salinicoccus hispanicus]MXQ50385.1 hypothetical protein [Salinicoccus hispanicus]
MSYQFEELFTDIQKDNRIVLDEIEPFEHPLVVLLRSCLEEQEYMLERLIEEFEEGETELKDIKTNCSALFHANQKVNPYFAEWRRATGWIGYKDDNPSKELMASLQKMLDDMQDDLIEIASKLDEEYGESTTKYFIPTFYLPEERVN